MMFDDLHYNMLLDYILHLAFDYILLKSPEN